MTVLFRTQWLGVVAGALLATSCDEILIAIQSPAEYATVISSTVPVWFTAEGTSGAVSYACKLDAEPERPCTPDDRFTEVADGQHSLTVSALDATGRRGTKTHQFSVDTRNTFPRALILRPTNGETLSSPDVTVTFSIERSLPSDTILCGLDSGPRVPCRSPHVFANVPDGLHEITVSASSPLGWSTFDRTSVLVSNGTLPPPTIVEQVAAGYAHTCALLAGGRVRCWGDNAHGALGYGTFRDLSTSLPASQGDVNVGGEVTQLALGGFHSCALLTGGRVRCWGHDQWGQLGYAFYPAERFIGGVEHPASAGDVNVGAPVLQLTAGRNHTCALVDGGRVRCWGGNSIGELGYGHTRDIGTLEPPASAGDVDVGGPVVQIKAGENHTCALLASGQVRCWGYNGWGQLGYPGIDMLGNDEIPSSVSPVDVGGPVRRIAAGGWNTCALLMSGEVRCWGALNTANGWYLVIGDDETPAAGPIVNIGGEVASLDVGGSNVGRMCAVLTTGGVRCWGAGVLGYESGETEIVPIDEVANRGDIDVGLPAQQVTAGARHTCAIVNGGVRCWGSNDNGQLGYGHLRPIGDDEPPSSAGNVIVGFE